MKVAIYCRLSEEDRNKQFETDDSNSIQNQKAMLLQYVVEQGGNFIIFTVMMIMQVPIVGDRNFIVAQLSRQKSKIFIMNEYGG